MSEPDLGQKDAWRADVGRKLGSALIGYPRSGCGRMMALLTLSLAWVSGSPGGVGQHLFENGTYRRLRGSSIN